MNRISFGETLDLVGFMLPNTLRKIAVYTDIKGTAFLASQRVHTRVVSWILI